MMGEKIAMETRCARYGVGFNSFFLGMGVEELLKEYCHEVAQGVHQ
jgi:hypothetical protein